MAFVLWWARNLLLAVLLLTACNVLDCYDPLDPNGNITIKFDIHKWTPDGYQATVTVQNSYQYRHIEKPGWTLGWAWSNQEIIWSMAGALALRQGNCSDFKTQIPHSCERAPRIVDHLPDVAAENRSENCCRGGLISAWGINSTLSSSSFEMVVGNLGGNSSIPMPQNIIFLGPGPGYTCSPLAEYPPTAFPANDARREVQVFRTWKSTCTYSSFLANKAPVCCVSMSAFYNKDVTQCPTCSCACRPADDKTVSCVGNDYSNLSTELDYMVKCSEHMCPVRVHWHLKNNYREYWRVKLTISNYHYGLNYTDWNVVVQHPGFSQKVESYSFNTTTLRTIADTGERLVDEVALFWGKPFYNSELLQAVDDQPGSVTTDIILRKDLNVFTLSNGWAFPRRIYFNGENCEMPTPEDFPGLPS